MNPGDSSESVREESQIISMATRRCVRGDNRRVYSRSEIEALRFLDVDLQRRRWNEVYTSLEEAIAREYQGLRARDDLMKTKQGKFAGKKNDSQVVGRVSLLNKVKDSGIIISSDIAYGETLLGSENFTKKDVAYCDHSNTDQVVVNDDDDDDDDDSDEFDSIQKPAFLVEGEPDFDTGPPLDGLEYLRRVRWEAAKIPKVKVAQLKAKFSGEQTPYMPSIPDIAACPVNLLPSKDWEDTFLANFSKLREAFSEFETSCNLAFLTTEDSLTPPVRKQKPKGDPTLTAILTMDTASRASVLRSSISLFETSSSLSRDDCLWLFALSATVDAPLDSDTCASMRCLLRKCSSLLAAKSDFDDEVAMLSILIAIAGKYFRQSEN